MNNKIKYEEGPMKEIRIISDFLPSPEELAFREETIKVTMSLSKASLAFFKQEAAKHQIPYQRMIRRLLDEYAARHSTQ